MTNQDSNLSMKKSFASMGGMSKEESEDEEFENQSLLVIEQTDKYDFLALVAIAEREEKESNSEEEEDKQDQVSFHHIKENLDSYSKRELESLCILS
ncbi:hypothetical protein H5410_014324 [Solanum commersonii]|uniref:Uncharacterized protein n=1 Tax=Solanum commersonii TaxID=4109 RepID=A0A9J5ZR22_SOLCO|nr:hypothetical protein H5410_014324 [Solanum commersonii]